MNFSRRREAEQKCITWCLRNGLATCPSNVLVWLQTTKHGQKALNRIAEKALKKRTRQKGK